MPGIIHCNLSTKNVLLAKVDPGDNDSARHWFLSDFSSSAQAEQFLGSVSPKGHSKFHTGVMPPEMFTRLSPEELKTYLAYWEYVEKHFDVSVNHDTIYPKIDVKNGVPYTVKCHFEPLSEQVGIDGEVPLLPYSLVEASPSSDLWAFGLLIFYLCSGRPLFPVHDRTDHLLGYDEVANWTEEVAKSYVYEYVSDYVAQDILLRLLSPLEERQSMSMETILKHRFFVGTDDTTMWLEKRKIEAAGHKRKVQGKLVEAAEKIVLEEKTVDITCWDLKLLGLIYYAPTEMMKRLSANKMWREVLVPVPCALSVLPYQVEGLKIDDNLPTQFLAAYLNLCKACQFATTFQRHMEKAGSDKPKWSASDTITALGLSISHFGDIQSSMTALAAKHIEMYRSNPLAVALKVVEEEVQALLNFFNDTPAFVYLVDEFHRCIISEDNGTKVYPVKVSDERRKESLLQHSLMFMHLCGLYARGVSKDVFGLVPLFLGKGVPSSDDWRDAGIGLANELNEDSFRREIRILEDALSSLFQTRYSFGTDDFCVVRNVLYECDPKRSFANLQRVCAANNMCLWTTAGGVHAMREQARSQNFSDLLKLAIDA